MAERDVTFFSKGAAVGGPDELQDKYTNRGFSALGPNLTEGAAAVSKRSQLGTVFRDNTTRQVYVATDLHGNKDPNVIDLYKEPENYQQAKERRDIDVIGKLALNDIGRDRNHLAWQISQLQEKEFPGSALTDEGADGLMDEIESGALEGPKLEAAKRRLGNWAFGKKIQRRTDAVETALDGYESLDQVEWTPEDQALAETLGSDPSIEKAYKQNVSYLSAISGQDPSEVSDNIAILRPWLADAAGIKEPEKANDLDVFNAISGHVKKRKEAEQKFDSILTSGIHTAIENTANRQYVDSDTALSKAGEGIELDPRQVQVFKNAYADAQEFTNRYRDILMLARDVINQETGMTRPEVESDQTIESLVDRMYEMPENDRKQAMRYLVAYFQAEGKDKNFFMQSAESVGRGFEDLFAPAQGMANEVRLDDLQKRLGGNEQLYWIPDAGFKTLKTRFELETIRGLEDAYEPVPASETTAALNFVTQAKNVGKFYREFRHMLRTEIDPVRPLAENGFLRLAEEGWYGALGSIGYMVAAPTGWTVMAMSADAYDDLSLRYPDLPIEQKIVISHTIGAIQGLIERLQVGQIASRIPGIRNLLGNLKNPAAWRHFFGRWGEQFGEEVLQDAVGSVVEGISHEMGVIMPDWSWQDSIGGVVDKMAANAAATFYFAIPGRYRGLTKSSIFQKVIESGDVDTIMFITGLSYEEASRVAAAPAEERETVARGLVTPEKWKAAATKQLAEMEAGATIHEQAAQAGEEIPVPVKLREGVFGIRYPDGRVVEVGDYIQASQVLQREIASYIAQGTWENNSLFSYFKERMPDVEWEQMEEAKALEKFVENGLASAEQIDTRARIAGIPAGRIAEVDGYTKSEIAEETLRHTIALVRDANPDVIVEEIGHVAYRNALARGQIQYGQFVEAVRRYGRRVHEFSLDNPALTKEQIRTIVDEGVASMVKAHFFGNLREIDSLSPGLRGFVAKIARYIREVFRNAYVLKKMIRGGEVSQDIQTFLSQTIGLQEPPAYTAQLLDAVNYLRGTGQKAAAFSIKASVAPTRRDMLKEFTAAEMKKRTESAKSFSVRPRPESRMIAPDLNQIAWEIQRFNPRPEEKAQMQLRALKRLKALEQAVKYKRAGVDPEVASLQATATLAAVVGAMPSRIRGKFPPGRFVHLQEYKTQGTRMRELIGAIDELNEILENHLQRDYSERIDDFFARHKPKSLDKTKAGFAQDFVNKAREAWKRSDPAVSQAHVKAMDDVLRSPESTARQKTDASLAIAMEISFGGHDAMNAESLAAAYVRLVQTRKEGVEAWRQAEEARIEAQRELSKAGVEQLGDFGEADRKERAEKEDKIVSFLAGAAVNHLNLAQIIGWVFGEKHGITQHFRRALARAHAASEDRQTAAKLRMRSALGKVIGANPGTFKGLLQISRETQRLNELHERRLTYLDGYESEIVPVDIQFATDAIAGRVDHNFTDKELSKLEDQLEMITPRQRKIQLERVLNEGQKKPFPRISLDGAIYLSMTWAQEDGKRKLLAQGIREDVIANLEAWIEKDAAAVAVRDFLRQEYESGYDGINKVFRRVYGFSLPKVGNYSPLRIDRAGLSDVEMSMEGTYTQSGITPGALHTRTPNSQPIDLQATALSVYEQHVAQTSHWIGYAETMREMRAVFSDLKLSRSIQSTYGRTVEKALHAAINNVASNGVHHAEGIAMQKAISRAYSARALTVLGSSFRTLWMQSDNAMRWMVATPHPSRWGSAFKDFFKNYRMILGDPMITRRIVLGWSPESRAVLSKANVDPTLLSDIASIGMVPLQYYDAYSIAVTATVAYGDAKSEGIKSGMSEQEAHAAGLEAADLALFEFGQPTAAVQRSQIEMQGPFTKLLFQFATDMRQKSAIYFGLWRKLIKGEDKVEAAMQIVWMNAIFMAGEFLMDMFQYAAGDSDDDWFEPLDYLRAILAGPTNGLFLAGEGINFVVGKLLGLHSFSNTANPMAREAQDLMAVLSKPETLVAFDNPQLLLKTWKKTLRALTEFGALIGAPQAAVSGTAIAAQSVRMLEDASTAAETIPERISK